MLLVGLYFVLGAVLAWAFLQFAVHRSVHARRRLGTALLVAAFIYVAFAMAAMESTWLLIEMGGVAVFGGFVWLGFRRSIHWIAVGWALHVVWDIALHSMTGVDFVPSWFPSICVGFDLAVAAYVVRAARDAVSRQPSVAAP